MIHETAEVLCLMYGSALRYPVETSVSLNSHLFSFKRGMSVLNMYSQLFPSGICEWNFLSHFPSLDNLVHNHIILPISSVSFSLDHRKFQINVHGSFSREEGMQISFLSKKKKKKRSHNLPVPQTLKTEAYLWKPPYNCLIMKSDQFIKKKITIETF